MFLARDGPLNDRKTDRAASREKSLRKRRSRLRELNSVTAAITQHVGLASTLDTDFTSIPSPPLTPSETLFLDATDLTKGRCFQDSLLPISLEAIEQNPALGSLTTDLTPASTALDGFEEPAQLQETTDVVDLKAAPDVSVATKSPKELRTGKDETSRVNSVSTGSSTIRPPSFDHPGTTRQGPRTAHLPPKEIQEERLREKQLRQEARRKSIAEFEKHAGDAVSSPSSTIGAASIATPMPADPSPLTSADEDSAPIAVQSVSKPRELTAEATAARKRNSLSESQKEIAHRVALGQEVDSPDVQLRLEQEQAVKATRDAAAAAAPSNTTSPSPAPPEPINMTDSTTEQGQASALVTSTVQPKATPSATAKPISAAALETDKELTCTDSAPASASVDTIEQTSSTQKAARVSSGVIMQKPVANFLNDNPRTLAPGYRRKIVDDVAPKASEQQTIRRQQRASQEKVQASPQDEFRMMRNEGYAALKGAAEDPAKDYLEPLFRIQIHEPPTGRPLHELLQKACKVVSTSDQFAGIHEKQDQRILRRIYQLQNANRWSLRQMEPCLEPAAPKTHMDHLLTEMKWMRTDFRQERKIKRATAKYLAEQCAEWVNAASDVRQIMQTSIRPVEIPQPSQPATTIPHSPAETNAENGDRHSQGGKSPPGLDDSITDAESMEDFDMPRTPQYATVVPSSFFSALNMDKDNLHLQESEAFHSALAELPLLTPFKVDETSLQSTTRRPVPAVSKFCDGKIMTKLDGPKKKRSRFDFEDEEELLSDFLAPSVKRPRASEEEAGLRPEKTDVALFDPENKLLRVRLHANTAFRPPSEFQMPSSQFYEFRTASQWTEEDQQTLRRLAKDYSFNWSLIADELSLPSRLTSAADRRTPWECFERWVELESLPNEMRKTLYFKTWNQRLETASRNNEVRYQTQLQQQAQTPGQPQTVMRRKTLPFKVDKRRQNRYLHTVDAMRKLARKREQQAHKHAEAQKAAHMRKQHENAAPKSGIPSPQEFSRMRQERDMQIAARQERYREQVLAQQRAAQMQRAGQFPSQQQAQPNAGPNRPGSNAPIAQNTPLQPGHPQQGVNQVHPHAHTNVAASAVQRNGHLAVPQMNMQTNVPQAQMQPNMRATPNQVHGSADNVQQRILEAQRAAQLKGAQMNGQQYQMAPPNRQSPGGAHVPNGMMANQSNPAMMNSMQAPGPTPNRNPVQQAQNTHSGHNGTASVSPHMPPPPSPANQAQQPQQLSSGHIPAITQISHQLQSQNPHATPEKIKELANEHMRQLVSQQQSLQARQNALSAAAGPHVATPSTNSSPAYNQNQASFHQNGMPNGQHAYNNTPTSGANHLQYSQSMRQRLQSQIQQQNNTAGANGSPRAPQASPNMAHASPNMTQSVPLGNRTPTPQMVRTGSSGGGAATMPQQPGMQSPGLQQRSPRPVPAGVARQ